MKALLIMFNLVVTIIALCTCPLIGVLMAIQFVAAVCGKSVIEILKELL